jgi:hypothetical protein
MGLGVMWVEFVRACVQDKFNVFINKIRVFQLNDETFR